MNYYDRQGGEKMAPDMGPGFELLEELLNWLGW